MTTNRVTYGDLLALRQQERKLTLRVAARQSRSRLVVDDENSRALSKARELSRAVEGELRRRPR